jgi:hypothetical protein
VQKLIIKISSKIKIFTRKLGSKLQQTMMKMKIHPKVREKPQEKRRDQDFNPKKEVPRQIPD